MCKLKIKKIKLIFKIQNDLDEEIRQVQQEIINQKKYFKGVTTYEKHQKLLKEIQNLEFKLDKSNQRYNQTVANNVKLRDEIDLLRKERKVY